MFQLMYPKPGRRPDGSRDPYAVAGRGGKPIASRFPEGLADHVMYRDWTQMWSIYVHTQPRPHPSLTDLSWPKWRACVAPGLDGAGSGPCSGRITMQHVKVEIGMSLPRIHREEVLVSLCRGHHLDTKAGANWATAHMDLQRAYLAKLYPDFWKTYIERNSLAHQP